MYLSYIIATDDPENYKESVDKFRKSVKIKNDFYYN